VEFYILKIELMGQQIFGSVGWNIVWNIVKISCVVVPILAAVAYATLYERKLIGWMHARLGPNRVGPIGLLQPIADSLKLISKEIILPAKSDKALYLLAPILTIAPSLAAWSVIPFSPDVVLSNINAGLLFLIAATSLEVYGVILAGWASNSKYAFLAAMRASAQMVSYELAIGFALVVVLMISGSLNLTEIVAVQQEGRFASMGLNFLSWNWLPLLPILVVYFISGVAETNRHPFDVVEGESEIVAGHMVEYSGMAFAVFFLAEYANMILISVLASLLFFGGWDAPIDALQFVPGWIWLGIKTFLMFTFFIWFRASFPRYRYDQIMRLGWKVFIPVTLFWLVVVAFWMKSPVSIWS
tara:strand:- start:2772 stop:3842 length:1071 start_codon:yes stop_codon:yes gene_type:complete